MALDRSKYGRTNGYSVNQLTGQLERQVINQSINSVCIKVWNKVTLRTLGVTLARMFCLFV